MPVFFDNAAIAVYADKRGGWKAAVVLFFSYLVLFQVALGALRYHFLISVHMVVTMAILTLKFRGFHLLIFSNMLVRLVMLLSASSCLQSLKFSLQEQKTRKLTMLVKFSLKSNSLKSKCYL